MHCLRSLVLFGLYTLILATTSSSDRFIPQAADHGAQPVLPTSAFCAFTLTPDQPLITLDYGYEVAGYPFFDVSEATGQVQIEVKYTEDFSGLSQPWSDGPFDFSVGVTNSYRVETFALNETGTVTSSLAQGGQRYQSIKLLTSGNVSFSSVGYVATIAPIDVDNLPSQFNSSNALYNNVWKLGARAVSAACFAANSYGAIWDISPTDGARVRGMRPPLTTVAANFENYTLEFETKIERGGSGWAMAWPLAGVSSGIQLNLVGNYPEATTFVNTNKTLLPPNSVVLAHGYGLVNQTTLPTYYLGSFEVPFKVQEGTWHNVTVVLGTENYVTVSVDGVKIFNVTLNSYYIAKSALPGSPSTFTYGSFGFGGWQDQVAHYRNVVAYASNGTEIYNNPLTDASVVLPEYGAQSNIEAVCLDGAKRDRLLWTGDFFHTSKILGASTARNDFASSTLQTFINWQLSTGQFPLAPVISLPSSATDVFASDGPEGPFYLLSDYHVLVTLAFSNYMSYSNDIEFATRTWANWKLAADWLLSQYNSTTSLFDLNKGLAAFLGPTGGSAVNSATVQALNGLADIALAINDTTSAAQWRAVTANTSVAINSLLWNEGLGTYINSQADPGNFSVAGIAFAITSGVAPASRASRSIAALSALQLSPGYKDSTTAAPSADSAGLINISPNTNGFLLSALFQSNATTEARYLIENLWAAMITNEATHSGASWEYVNTQGQPGLSLFTSLSHPWGGAPTYLLTEYLAGLQPVTFGYQTWVVAPVFRGLAVDEVFAQVKTPYGDIQVEWMLNSNGTKLDVTISAPSGTNGTIVLKAVYLETGTADMVVDVQGGQRREFSFVV